MRGFLCQTKSRQCLKVQDIVSAAVDEAKFQLTVDKLRQAREVPTREDPIQTVELLGDKYLLTKNERASILRHEKQGSGTYIHIEGSF